MAYLTLDEYNELTESTMESTKFNPLLKKASAILNNITSYFYVKNDIEKDNAWRVNQFKQALCAQIEYFDELGATTFESINNAPQSFSAGRTSVSNSSRSNSRETKVSKSLVAEEVYVHLSGTGLLYAGVAIW